MWSRELLDALEKGYDSYYQSEALRIPFYDDKIDKQNFQINTIATIEIPTYFMIAKCGSSSIFTNLDTMFNKKLIKTTMHKTFEQKYLGQSTKVNTNCGFTFVRNPVTRLISGYYTINRKIFGLHKTFGIGNLTIFANEGWNNRDSMDDGHGWRFLQIVGEPQRFIAFVEELIENPYKFSHIDPMSHITSILSKAFNVFLYSNISFIGRQEYFNKHWNELINHSHCSKWFRKYIKEDYQKNHDKKPIYAMWQYGKSSSFSDYNEVLGVNTSKIIPTVYYELAKNKTLYDRIVNYYWQDMVCFGYKPDFVEFQKYVKQFEIDTWKLTH